MFLNVLCNEALTCDCYFWILARKLAWIIDEKNQPLFKSILNCYLTVIWNYLKQFYNVAVINFQVSTIGFELFMDALYGSFPYFERC